MNLKKKELVISIVMVIVFSIIGLNLSVFASNGQTQIEFPSLTNQNNATGNTIQVINNTTNTNATGTIEIANNTNNPGQLANTGLEDLPWLVIAVCAVSAVFAYNKIREYNID